MQTQPKRLEYDVVIVGSGAGGGIAAHVLVEAGANVLMLEAGGWWDNTRDSTMLKMPYDSPRRGAGTPERPFGEFDVCIGGWQIPDEPYTVAAGQKFDWWRARMLGGHTNHWGRISLRFGPDDFRRKTIDGLGDDWPITYKDVAPYYDKVDQLVGIFGSKENLPNHPDSIFQPAPRPRCHELLIKQTADRLGIWCIPSRLSIITKQLHNRLPCHYCANCNRGCMTNSNFTSGDVLLFPAAKTGRLSIITDAMAREVTVDAKGNATGVSYIDKRTRQDRQVKARIVVLAARPELDHVMAKLEPVITQRLADKGFVFVNWGSGGWVQVFSKKPAKNLRDLKGMKLFTSAGDDVTVQWYKDNGFQPVPLSSADMLSSLTTGMIEDFPVTPLSALSFQWYKYAPYMLDVGISPLVGATIVNKKTWEAISEADRAQLMAAARKTEARFRVDVPRTMPNPSP